MRKFRLSAAALLCAGLLCAFAGDAFAAIVIHVDKAAQRMTVSVDGARRYSWPVSTGRTGHFTPAGNFTPFRLEEDHYSKEWDDAPMPHSIFFTKEGHAIHGSFQTKLLGQPASAGCVRLAPENAATLFALVKSEGLNNTKIVISGDEQMIASRTPSPSREPRSAPRPRDTNVARVSPNDYASDPDLDIDNYAYRMRRRYYEERYAAPRPPARVYAPAPYYPPYYAPRGYYYFGWN